MIYPTIIYSKNCICSMDCIIYFVFVFSSRNSTCPVCRTEVNRRTDLFLNVRPCQVVLRRFTIEDYSTINVERVQPAPRRLSLDTAEARRGNPARRLRGEAQMEPRTPTKRSRQPTTKLEFKMVECIICGKNFFSTIDQIFCSLKCRKAVE